jgi:hypothetical protein
MHHSCLFARAATWSSRPITTAALVWNQRDCLGPPELKNYRLRPETRIRVWVSNRFRREGIVGRYGLRRARSPYRSADEGRQRCLCGAGGRQAAARLRARHPKGPCGRARRRGCSCGTPSRTQVLRRSSDYTLGQRGVPKNAQVGADLRRDRRDMPTYRTDHRRERQQPRVAFGGDLSDPRSRGSVENLFAATAALAPTLLRSAPYSADWVGRTNSLEASGI